jgi:quercetin dioxygenase-like cupin family protein
MTDRQQIAADWTARDFSCELWTDPPGQRWEDFTHATNELVTVLGGDMEFEVKGQVRHPQPGEELLIPAGAVHSARNIGSTTARWLYRERHGEEAGNRED